MTLMNENIFFVGLMGAGKTTVGKLLAKKLKKTFFDTDQEIEKKLGVKVSSDDRKKLRATCIVIVLAPS